MEELEEPEGDEELLTRPMVTITRGGDPHRTFADHQPSKLDCVAAGECDLVVAARE